MIAIRGIRERSGLVDDADPRFLRLDHHALDLLELGRNLRVQGHRRFDRSLRMKFRRDRKS